LEEMNQDENTSTSMVDENTTSTYRLQKVLVERTCVVATAKKAPIYCEF